MVSTACSVSIRLWSFKPDPDIRIMGLGTYHPPNLNLPYIPNLSLTDGPSPISTSIPGMATIDPAPVTPYSFLSLRLAPFLPQSHQSNPIQKKVRLDSSIMLASGCFCSSQPMLRLSDRMTLNPSPTNP